MSLSLDMNEQVNMQVRQHQRSWEECVTHIFIQFKKERMHVHATTSKEDEKLGQESIRKSYNRRSGYNDAIKICTRMTRHVDTTAQKQWAEWWTARTTTFTATAIHTHDYSLGTNFGLTYVKPANSALLLTFINSCVSVGVIFIVSFVNTVSKLLVSLQLRCKQQKQTLTASYSTNSTQGSTLNHFSI